jgi:uncharacterized protein YPO0396
MIQRERIIDSRDALNKRIDSATAELRRLRQSQGGNHRRLKRILSLEELITKLENGVARLESLLAS